MLNVTYAECNIKAPYAECRQAECRGAVYNGLTQSVGDLSSHRRREEALRPDEIGDLTSGDGNDPHQRVRKS